MEHACFDLTTIDLFLFPRCVQCNTKLSISQQVHSSQVPSLKPIPTNLHPLAAAFRSGLLPQPHDAACSEQVSTDTRFAMAVPHRTRYALGCTSLFVSKEHHHQAHTSPKPFLAIRPQSRAWGAYPGTSERRRTSLANHASLHSACRTCPYIHPPTPLSACAQADVLNHVVSSIFCQLTPKNTAVAIQSLSTTVVVERTR